MQNLARILFVLNTIARYRLLALLPGHPLTWPVRALLWLFPGRWLPAPSPPLSISKLFPALLFLPDRFSPARPIVSLRYLRLLAFYPA